MMENENDLTRCEIVLHEFNKKSIDSFFRLTVSEQRAKIGAGK